MQVVSSLVVNGNEIGAMMMISMVVIPKCPLRVVWVWEVWGEVEIEEIDLDEENWETTKWNLWIRKKRKSMKLGNININNNRNKNNSLSTLPIHLRNPPLPLLLHPDHLHLPHPLLQLLLSFLVFIQNVIYPLLLLPLLLLPLLLVFLRLQITRNNERI